MTPGKSFDVAVIGGGVMGCAAARALAARKQRIVLFERAQIGHEAGSSRGRSRIIRLAYGHVDYIALCRAAYPVWQRLEEEVDEPLLRITGGLDLTFTPVPSWQATADAMAEAGVAHEVLDRDAIAERFPQFNLPDDAKGLFQPQAGVLHADRCMNALATGAKRSGAILKDEEEILSIKPRATGVELRTAKGTYEAARLVIAAGAAANGILSSLGLDLPLTVSKEQVAFFRPRNPTLYGPDRFPIFILHLGGVLLSSGFPHIREDGLKLMLENKRPTQDGDDAVDPRLLAQLEAKIREILPGLEGEAHHAETCRYTLTPDEDFIIDRHPAHRDIVIVSACSGHGFKFAPLFGEAIADLVTDHTPSIKLDRFLIDRPALKESRAQSRGINNRRRTS